MSTLKQTNISECMAKMLTSSAVSRGFEPQSGHTKDNKMCVGERERTNPGWLRIWIRPEWSDMSTDELLFQ